MNVLGCEGNDEVYLINYLIDKGYLIFKREEILDRRPIHFRQPSEIAPLIDLLPPETDIIFYRIGDKQTDEFNLKRFEFRKDHIQVIRVCTTPELEILVIINENLLNEYLKVKSLVMPKQFVKEKVKGFTTIKEYLKNHDLYDAIIKYKEIKKTREGEICLADLLK